MAGHSSLGATTGKPGNFFYSVQFFNLYAFANFLAVCKPISRRDFFIASPGVFQ
jgi:hypothetical protein